jgi:uncharacterized protein
MIDQPSTLLLLVFIGFLTGVVAGILGIGGGVLIVPILTFWQVSLVQATATSLVGVWLSAVSGSWQNWRKGQLTWRSALGLAAFGMPTAWLGAWLGAKLPGRWIAFGFAGLMLVTIELLTRKQQLQQTPRTPDLEPVALPPPASQGIASIGLLGGLLSGLFGIGGGTIMVPLQMLYLSIPIKAAVRTSLGAIVLIAAVALMQHSLNGNVLWAPGICLAIGGSAGAQLGTRLLPRISARWVNRLFRGLLLLLAVYMVWKGLVK